MSWHTRLRCIFRLYEKNVSYLFVSGLSNIKLHLNVHLLRNTQQSSGDTKQRSNYLVVYPMTVGEIKIMNRGQRLDNIKQPQR